MEEYLKQLFQKDGVMIFHTDYHLFLKLLNHFPVEPLRNDAYCINAILGGNAFYETIVNCLKNENHKVDRTMYNVFVDQMYSGDRFWKKEVYDSGHFEQVLRMLFEITSLDLSDIPRRIAISSHDTELIDIDVSGQLEEAEEAYKAGSYKVAYDKAVRLFENGVGEAASLLGAAYYAGNGTKKDYNRALYYMSYPHTRSVEKNKKERMLLEKLLEMRDKTAYNILLCMSGIVLIFLVMIITKFFFLHTGLALISMFLLAAGGIALVFVYRKRYIFDFSWCFFLLGCMFLSILML